MSDKRDMRRLRPNNQPTEASRPLELDFSEAQAAATPENALVASPDNGLTFGNIRITDVGIDFGETPVDFETWGQLRSALAELERRRVWLIADFLAYGIEKKYGVLTDIAEALDIPSGTARAYKQVAEKVPMEIRISTLSFGHHQLVKNIADRDVQIQFLQEADRDGLTVDAMRERIKQWRMAQKGEVPPEEHALFDVSNLPRAGARLHKLWSDARRGDQSAKDEVLYRIAEHRQWLNQLEKTLEK